MVAMGSRLIQWCNKICGARAYSRRHKNAICIVTRLMSMMAFRRIRPHLIYGGMVVILTRRRNICPQVRTGWFRVTIHKPQPVRGRRG